MKRSSVVLLALLALLISACGADVCPVGSVSYVADPALLPGPPTVDALSTPTLIQIGRRQVEVDRVIHGPLCNDTWSGTIYVACDVEIVQWTEEEGSTFLDGCALTIEQGTVVYVAAHNNAAYYRGCAACHSSAGATPSP